MHSLLGFVQISLYPGKIFLADITRHQKARRLTSAISLNKGKTLETVEFQGFFLAEEGLEPSASGL